MPTALAAIGAVALCAMTAAGVMPGRQAPQSTSTHPACASASELQDLLARSAEAYDARDAGPGFALLNQAFDLATSRNCVVERAEALRRLAMADAYELRFDAAQRRLREALPVFHQYGPRLSETQTLIQLGYSLFSNGMRGEAEVELLRARALALELGDRTLLLSVYDNLVYAMGPGPEKERLRVEALRYVRATPAGRAVECNVLHQWGDELFGSARYDLAFEKITEAAACFQEVGDRSRLGRAYVSLGRVYRAHGRLDLALDQYVRAVGLQQQVGDRLAEGQSFNAIGVTLGGMGRYEESSERLTEALGIARRIGSARLQSLVLPNIAGLYLSMHQYQRAATMLEEWLASDPDDYYTTQRLSQLTRAYLGLNAPQRALTSAERAVAAADAGKSDPRDRVTALAARASALAALGRYEDASADLKVAVDAVESIRFNTLRDDYLTRGFWQADQWLFSSSISLLQKQSRSKEALEVAEQARARAFLDLLADRERTADGPTETAPPGGRGEAATFAGAVAAAASLRSTIVTYWVGESETFVWVVNEQGQLRGARIDVGSNDLLTMVRAATGLGRDADDSGVLIGSRSGTRHWRDLYRLLVQPIRGYLPKRQGSRLTIVPHGPLFGLPFAALRDESDRYLIESYEIHYVPAINTLTYTSRQDRSRASSALLVADPGLDTVRDRATPLPPLPWASLEVKSIAALLRGQATVLTGADATEARVREQLPGKRLLHFATHGIVQNEERLSSYLALRASTNGDEDPATDGRLTANETYHLHLDADLIVLSGCRTALGPIMGDGVIGFTRAFLAAGATSVVATMWDVADRTSFEVMKSFYGAWTGGATKSGALRKAQLSVIAALRAGKIRTRGVALPESPRLWAGYVLVGQP
jgi:CHAT domain-containing protein/tetratricopeptide (TPR) repeat protein